VGCHKSTGGIEKQLKKWLAKQTVPRSIAEGLHDGNGEQHDAGAGLPGRGHLSHTKPDDSGN
jgi:hypothetical protein